MFNIFWLVFTNEILVAKMKEKRLVDRSSISNLVKTFDLNTKPTTLVTNADLMTEPERKVRFQVFYWRNISGISYFEEDGTQNYLFFFSVRS